MRAERDILDFSNKPKKTSEKRLAYEIALGIWLGGMALTATSGIIGYVMFSLAVGALNIKLG